MTAFLFPGQGSQAPGMGSDFYERSAAAREIFGRAAAGNEPGFLDRIFQADQDALNQTQLAQPALLAVEVAIAAHLKTLGICPSVCAGHSLGEIPALVSAGGCDFEDALCFTRARARLMSENVPEGGMAAVLGLSPESIEPLLPQGAQVANYNGPEQTIITGSSEALAAAMAAIEAAGAKRVLPLKVSGPFHSQYMQPAAAEMARILADVPFSTPQTPFISSVTGQEESDPGRIRDILSGQLVQPVRWTDVMRRIGPVEALEVGPGSVLRGLARRMDQAPRVQSVGTFDQAEALGARTGQAGEESRQ